MENKYISEIVVEKTLHSISGNFSFSQMNYLKM